MRSAGFGSEARISQNLTPPWHGDSIGHYEGDTLVVDTIGMKVGAINVIDRAGSPYSRICTWSSVIG